jgi:hypothetical protein
MEMILCHKACFESIHHQLGHLVDKSLLWTGALKEGRRHSQVNAKRLTQEGNHGPGFISQSIKMGSGLNT